MTAPKSTSGTAKKAAAKAPAKKAAARPSSSSTSTPTAAKSGASLVTWDELIGGTDEDPITQPAYGLVLEEGIDHGEGSKLSRVAVLTDFRVLDPKQLKKL